MPVCCCVLWRPVSAQSLSGLIVDENSNPVPYANVFIRELSSGAASDDRGRYFITLTPGNYHVVVSSVGYHSQSFEISIPDKGITRNIRLSSSATELQELVVKAKRRDPAFEIIQKVIDHKEANRKIVSSFRTSIYVRAAEVID